MPSAGRWYGLAALVVVLDQISKWVVLNHIRPGETIFVTPFWNWVLTFNPGAAFSFLADQPGWQRWFFTVLALAVAGWIALELRRHPGQKLLSFALALVMGGALGNVIDRARFGAVVDFVQWHVAGYYWPAFNVADSAITVGAILLLFSQLTATDRQKDSPMTTTVRSDSYLTLHYRITTLDGDEFLSTFDMSPATLQMGSGQLADNLESVLIGLPAHERFVFQLEPNEAFGQHNARLVERIARSGLPADMELKPNSVVEFTAPNGGTFAGFLRELDATHALFDFNHPLAGKAIRFEVKIIGIM